MIVSNPKAETEIEQKSVRKRSQESAVEKKCCKGNFSFN